MKKKDIKELFAKSDWNDETIIQADLVISKIAKDYLGLDIYPNQFEITSS